MAYDHRQFFILSVYHFDDLRPEVAWRVNFIIDDVIDCFSPVCLVGLLIAAVSMAIAHPEEHYPE